jgi:putative phosphoesterase
VAKRVLNSYQEVYTMLIAILSDVHDNIWNLKKVLPQLEKAEALLFCGDFCAPFTLKMMAEGFSGPVHCVFGNNDGDALFLSRIARQADNVTLHSQMGELELGGRRIAIIHYPHIASGLAASGKYDAVFSGHTREHKVEKVGSTLWVDPGEVMGRFGQPSFGLYDTASGEFTLRAI